MRDGILKQIEESDVSSYDSIDLEGVERLLEDYGKMQMHRKTFVIKTGEKGADQFNQMFVVENIREMARYTGPHAASLMDKHDLFDKITFSLSEIKREMPLLNINNIFKGLDKLQTDYEIQ